MIIRIEGIGEVHAEVLEAAGIATTEISSRIMSPGPGPRPGWSLTDRSARQETVSRFTGRATDGAGRPHRVADACHVPFVPGNSIVPQPALDLFAGGAGPVWGGARDPWFPLPPRVKTS
jgi:hypothetical protein